MDRPTVTGKTDGDLCWLKAWLLAAGGASYPHHGSGTCRGPNDNSWRLATHDSLASFGAALQRALVAYQGGGTEFVAGAVGYVPPHSDIA